MAERGLDFWFNFKMVCSGIGWVFRKTFRERFLIPRPSSLHSVDELMAIVGDLTSDHGGTGAAFKYAHRALELRPDHLGANRFMAYYYMEMGKYEEALPFAQLVAEHQPGSVFAHLSHGHVCMEQGRYQEALNEFKEVLVLFPNSPEMRVMRAKAQAARG